ncbi:MAG TPA: VOC family protein, partial [Acidimicrobiales bacterium]
MTRPTGYHHLAFMTKDMKAQLEFFTQVMGLPLVALFPMHGVEGAWHGFVQLDESTFLAFCQVPGVEQVESTVGVTHAGTGAGVSAPGTMQHLAMKVGSEEELLALRDRLRTNGVVVMGPIDHGMCRSLYFAGPEGLTLEAAWSGAPLDPDRWIDPEVCEAAGITPDDVARFRSPAPFTPPAEPVPQPAIDPAKPHLVYPEADYAAMVALPDDVVTRSARYTEPP